MKQTRFGVLVSDLADCRNPVLLKKYPHLGDERLIAELEAAISKERVAQAHLRVGDDES